MSDAIWTPELISALAVIFVLAALTMPAGIGGGILFVPVLRLIGEYTQGEASALSQVLITGAAAGSILFQILWQLRHSREPLLAQPYYVLVMMPALLAGSLVGVYLNKWLPELISLVALVLLCAVSSIVIFRKGSVIYNKETAQKEAILMASRRVLSPRQIPETPPPPAEFERAISLLSIEAGVNILPEVGVYLEGVEAPAESFLYQDTSVNTPSMSMSSMRRRPCGGLSSDRIAPKCQPKNSDSWLTRLVAHSGVRFACFVCGYWLVIIIFTLLRGSHSNPSFSGIVPCEAGYWVMTGSQVFFGIIVSFLAAFSELKLILGTFLAGIVSTFSGASGGILLNPMLLSRGLDPQQTAATSTIIMFVMASCSALEFLLDGKVEPILASTTAVTFVGSVLGMTGVTWLIHKLGRQSLLVFLLAGLVVAGGIMLVYLGIDDTVQDIQNGTNPLAMGTLC